jgi:hypothetical protein
LDVALDDVGKGPVRVLAYRFAVGLLAVLLRPEAILRELPEQRWLRSRLPWSRPDRREIHCHRAEEAHGKRSHMTPPWRAARHDYCGASPGRRKALQLRIKDRS